MAAAAAANSPIRRRRLSFMARIGPKSPASARGKPLARLHERAILARLSLTFGPCGGLTPAILGKTFFSTPPGPRGRRSTPDSAMRPRAQKCLVMALALCRGALGRHHPRRRVIQYPRAARFDREAAAYWIPRLRGV